MPTLVDFQLPDPAATDRLAALLATSIEPGLCIWLSGELGSGKTHLARGLLRALGWQGAVRSPTYTLLETYAVAGPAPGPGPEPGKASADFTRDPGGLAKKPEAESGLMLYHFDLYRMASPEEWVDAGFDDLPGAAVRLVEWPARGGSLVPTADLHLEFAVSGRGRRLRLTALTRLGEETWYELESALFRQPAGSALDWSLVR
ncbi:MAG: tRNA (adenosine(37)-N6)-threonylcarbamoyltransferase complex ATPase subunit type 1 TsaE [Rhodocyclaceae bacterium]|nr:tRNA (adenosine(37)-N6)-threonylcarbamoyltransferase complex ATPase subunit type 1 TsaE [Rhodocyclaceae bacterium]